MSGEGDGSQPAGDNDDVAKDAPEPKKKHDGRVPTIKLRSLRAIVQSMKSGSGKWTLT